MKKIILILIILLIAGCASNVPKTVQVPVPVACPKPNIPPMPHVPIQDLKSGDRPDIVMKAYMISYIKVKNWGEKMKAQLEVYQ